MTFFIGEKLLCPERDLKVFESFSESFLKVFESFSLKGFESFSPNEKCHPGVVRPWSFQTSLINYISPRLGL